MAMDIVHPQLNLLAIREAMSLEPIGFDPIGHTLEIIIVVGFDQIRVCSEIMGPIDIFRFT